MNAQPTAATTAPPSPVAALVQAHATERRLLDELTLLMQRQRAAVAADDLQGVDDTVFAIHRALGTLAEARRGREGLARALAGGEDPDGAALADALGGELPPALREAREALRAAAGRLAREVALNRDVLREALSANEAYVRALYGGAAQAAAPDAGAGGAPRLLDRTV